MFTPTNQVAAPAFVRYVTAQLISKFGADAVYSRGLRVVTTLHPRVQSIAQATVTETIAQLAYRRVSQGALVAIDPTNGDIVAMVGSANPGTNGGQYNLAVWPPRNPGSSMKVFTYTAAIATGQFTMTTPVVDGPISYRDPISGEVYSPKNYDGKYHGTCQLQQCMGNSLNIPAVKVELAVGVSRVVETARLMGAPPYVLHYDAAGNPDYTTDDQLNVFGPSLTLGGYGETPLQMATAISVIAASGVLHPPHGVKTVSKDGHVLYTHQDGEGARQAVDPKVAFIMQQMMSNDNNRAMIFGRNSLLTLPHRRVGVKTGTSDSFADAWTNGFTPHLAVSVWGGNPDWRTKMTQNSDSYYIAAPIFHRFMEQALDNLGIGDEWYSPPPGLDFRNGNWYLPGTR
jgi:membrane peptidoglycan carboxypeptidase